MVFTNVIEHLLGDPIQIRVLRILTLKPEGATGRSLGVMANTSSFKIHQVLKHLVEQGIVTETILGRAHLYRINADHHFFKKIEELFAYENKILRNIGHEIKKTCRNLPISIILYGSMARGEEEPASDIDVLVVYTDKGLEIAKTLTLGSLMEKIARQYGNTLSIKQIGISELHKRLKKKDPFIRNIFKEGKSLAGRDLIGVLNYDRES